MAISDTYFYDKQIRRYLLQFIRMFSNFNVEMNDRTGNATLVRVPVKYGDASRQGLTILQDNSENKMIPTPQISVYISELSYDRDRMQEPNFVDKFSVRQRTYDDTIGAYTNRQANAVTVERHMPVPYKIGINVDVWTSNTDQKLQLLEQILALFNPSLELQTTDNYLDWTSLTTVDLESVTWSSRTVPVGTEDTIDLSTISFSSPIWMSLPAKVKKLGVIQKIITSIWEEDGEISNSISDNALLLGTRRYFTPMNYGVMLVGNQLKLLSVYERVSPKNNEIGEPQKGGEDLRWGGLVDQYGKLENGISQVRLEQENGNYVVGTVSFHPTDPYVLLFNVDSDTIPSNTLPAVDKIVDPKKSGPGSGLPSLSQGQRYLLLGNIGAVGNQDGADAWKGLDGVDLIAEEFDIIEFDGVRWNVVFDASKTKELQYVTNITTGIQYKFNGAFWVKSYEGEYINGLWSLVI
jgi:hypothetical protein